MKLTSIPTVPPISASEAHAEAFNALSHLSRLRVFFFLVGAGREVAAGEIQAALGLPGPTLTHHLDVLRRAQLVRRRKEARFVYYSVVPETVSDLVRILTACC